ncbi:MAG TPA: HAD family hydrolase, partial [Acidobacteriota bacterium]|nr:HAD family hydrolase [Acidobacteriota bacterium]
MAQPIHHVLLFDIDGTLITTGGAGRRAMEAAFRDVHGVADAMAEVVLSGKIDPMIYDEVCRRFRLAPAMDRFREAYPEHLAEELP